MNIKYWTNYSKKKNSTAQPTSGTTLSVTLKDDCSIINPIIRSAAMPANANYIYIADFNRYYFVTNVVYITKDLKEFSCEVDVLATYKSTIGSTVARIAFAATGYDTAIADSRICTKTSKIKYSNSADLTSLTSNGCYALTVFNNDSQTSAGFGTIYLLDADNMSRLKKWMANPTIYDALEQYLHGAPLESIYSCIWVPFNISANPGSAVSSIHIGNQDTSLESPAITGYVLGAQTSASDTASITIPYRYNDFRDSEPYTSMELYLPGVGYTDFNISDWLDSTSVDITYTFDYANGDLTYYLDDFNNYLIQTATCNVASPCALAQTLTNGSGILGGVGGAVTSLGGFALSAATGNAMGAMASAAGFLTSASSIALSANKRATSIKGSVGGRTATDIKKAFLTGFYMDTEDVTNANYISKMGRPVAVTHAINSHSGFVLCDNASVNISGTSIEKDRVNSYLNSGFYYE